ncbi:hypothetical protein Jiend_56750 [Micromonospora endophytica]|uniref:hypothetical protein n=1 Tax=Micromonospora endophytica TaxID=515350 RepID=UPI001C34326B|nr:hypothetical protein [Micromonospora endophytica]BCJ62253.1 hypothetical protein Jiend_56750 [Micromonospora endophytica]
MPYGPGGSFTVQLKITPRFGDVDCTTRRCVVSTRNDHTRGADRSQDVRVPVSFATAPASPTARATAAPATTATRSAAPPSVSAGGGPTSAPPASSATAANNPDAATGTGASAAASDQPLLTTQVSDSSPAGRWFNAVLAGLAAMLIVLVVLRARRWRRVKP